MLRVTRWYRRSLLVFRRFFLTKFRSLHLASASSICIVLCKGLSVSSWSDPGKHRGLKRKQLSFEEGEIDEDTEDAAAAFDLFTSNSPKKDRDAHPDMKKLMKTGTDRMKNVGFSSPKPESQHVTMYEIESNCQTTQCEAAEEA